MSRRRSGRSATGASRPASTAGWNIGTNPNGGYALLPALRAMLDVAAHPDPLSVTVHFLRPAIGDRDADVTARIVRAGRSTTNATATMSQDGTPRLIAHAVLGDLTDSGARRGPRPGPGARPRPTSRRRTGASIAGSSARVSTCRSSPGSTCASDRIRSQPDRSRPAVVEGWIRLADGTPPDTRWLPLFADAFPPALRTRMGPVGWVPTIELTVHVRRRPAAGWVLARFECDDVEGGRMIESGTLWDSAGAVVARSRQLGLVLVR